MLKAILIVFLIGLAASVGGAAGKENPMVWHDAAAFTVEGRGWSDTPGFYYRLPARAKEIVNDGVWGLASNTAGFVIRFVSDTPEIQLRWTLSSANLAMNHMAATGVSGVDLYVRHQGKWRWLAVGRPSQQSNESTLIANLKPESREYALYLPLYNGITSLEIGVPDGARVQAAPPRTRDVKPVVFYGTSITQGGCASRPGMAYTAIIGRHLDIPVINLGFSGNGRCEREVADLLAELDPSVFVIDPLPNMTDETTDERIRYLLQQLRAKHPETPVILVENVIFEYLFIRTPDKKPTWPRNAILEKVYKDVAPEWKGKLFYVKADHLLGDDGEGTVDGVHPTDLGFLRMAKVLTPVVEKALGVR